jgi:hypothetical protein
VPETSPYHKTTSPRAPHDDPRYVHPDEQPELVGATALAEMLGLASTRIARMRDQGVLLPAWKVKDGHDVWLRVDAERWAEELRPQIEKRKAKPRKPPPPRAKKDAIIPKRARDALRRKGVKTDDLNGFQRYRAAHSPNLQPHLSGKLLAEWIVDGPTDKPLQPE